MSTIVLVGRPNTGKSTLFNRIVGGRVAITLAEPGITRDRLMRPAEWLGRNFEIMDTGGLVPDSTDEISHQVERQVKVALSEADVIVLVVDGTTGRMALDEEVALRLRREDRKFLLAVNKCDVKRRYDPNEFHGLGADRVFSISAEVGTGIDELLDEALKRMPEERGRSTVTDVCLSILGRPNVGKSSLLNLLLGSERSIVTAIPGTTRDVVEERLELEGRRFRLLDTAGIRRKSRVSVPVEYYSVTRALDTIERSDVCLLVMDATEGPTNQDKKIANLVESRYRGLVVVANKMDLVPKHLLRKVHEWVRDQLKFTGYAPILYTSCTENQGIDDIVSCAGRVYDAGTRRMGRALLKEAVLSRIEKRQPKYNSRVLGLTQTGVLPPTFRLRLSDPKAATTAYERFVTATIRECFSFEGYRIKLEITK
jgi:GTPase